MVYFPIVTREEGNGKLLSPTDEADDAGDETIPLPLYP